jgi:hypothetical protein
MTTDVKVRGSGVVVSGDVVPHEAGKGVDKVQKSTVISRM